MDDIIPSNVETHRTNAEAKKAAAASRRRRTKGLVLLSVFLIAVIAVIGVSVTLVGMLSSSPSETKEYVPPEKPQATLPPNVHDGSTLDPSQVAASLLSIFLAKGEDEVRFVINDIKRVTGCVVSHVGTAAVDTNVKSLVQQERAARLQYVRELKNQGLLTGHAKEPLPENEATMVHIVIGMSCPGDDADAWKEDALKAGFTGRVGA